MMRTGFCSGRAQIVFGSSDGKMYSLDATTGKPNNDFGDNGIVNLNTEEILHGLPGRDALSEPPTVYKNLVITGGMTQENPPLGPAGDVRAWDMHTGKLVWTFRTIPAKGEKGNETWAGDSWKNRSGVNVRGFITVDAQRGIAYLPLGAPSVDQYGGDRAGDNLFSTSLVAVNANTGKYLWHFQVTHHDIWDADMTGAPALIDVKKGGKTIPAVIAVSKVGLSFILDRVTGKPIFGVEERAVPQSEVPAGMYGEDAAISAQAATPGADGDEAGRHCNGHAGNRSGLQKADGGNADRRPVSSYRLQPSGGAVPRKSWRRELVWHVV